MSSVHYPPSVPLEGTSEQWICFWESVSVLYPFQIQNQFYIHLLSCLNITSNLQLWCAQSPAKTLYTWYSLKKKFQGSKHKMNLYMKCTHSVTVNLCDVIQRWLQNDSYVKRNIAERDFKESQITVVFRGGLNM